MVLPRGGSQPAPVRAPSVKKTVRRVSLESQMCGDVGCEGPGKGEAGAGEKQRSRVTAAGTVGSQAHSCPSPVDSPFPCDLPSRVP